MEKEASRVEGESEDQEHEDPQEEQENNQKIEKQSNSTTKPLHWIIIAYNNVAYTHATSHCGFQRKFWDSMDI